MKLVLMGSKGVSGRSSGRNKKRTSRRKSAGTKRRTSQRKGTGQMAVKRKSKSKKKKGAGRRRIRRRRRAASGAVRRRKSAKGRKSTGRRRRRRVGKSYLQQGRRQGRKQQRLRLAAESGKMASVLGGGLAGYYGLGALSKLDALGDLSQGQRIMASSALGLVLAYGSSALIPAVRRGILGNVWDGVKFVSALGLGIGALKAFGGTQLGGDLRVNELDQAGLVSGPGGTGVSILSRADLDNKIAELRGERDELEGALGSVAGELTPEQEAVYVSAAEHVASIQGPLDAAAKMLENGRMYEGAEAIKDAMSLAIVGRALLSGLTAGAAAQQQMPAQQQALPQLQQAQAQADLAAMQAQQAADLAVQQVQKIQQQIQQGQLPASVQIQNAADGQVIDVPAPADSDVVVQTTGGGSGLNLDGLAQWASWVSQQQPGWAPSEVATAFVLKWLANNQHYFAYGPNAVVSHNNFGPGNLYGYSNVAPQQSVQGLRLTTSGQVFTCGTSQEEILGTVSGIFESHFGSY